MGLTPPLPQETRPSSDRSPRPHSTPAFVFSGGSDGAQMPYMSGAIAPSDDSRHSAVEGVSDSVTELGREGRGPAVAGISSRSESIESHQDNETGSSQGGAPINSLLESMRISSRRPESREDTHQGSEAVINLDEINAALDAVGASPAAQTRSSDPHTPLSVPRPAARRRSSPRVARACHGVEEEELPDDAFHAAPFQEGLAVTKQLISDLTGVLGSGSIHLEPDSTMRSLHERAEGLSRFQPPCTRTVGFVGDSGVGRLVVSPAVTKHIS